MNTRLALWVSAIASLGALAGCSVPSLQALHEPEPLVHDPGLLGEWESDSATPMRVTIRNGVHGKYEAVLSSDKIRSLAGGLKLEVGVTEIGADRYVDLYLSRDERELLIERYGYLVLPVHQFMAMRREHDTLSVWFFDAEWLRRASAEHGFVAEIVKIGGDEVPVVTGDARQLRAYLSRHAHDAGARTSPTVFKRKSSSGLAGSPR